ncbi:MAG: hypothetical protein WD491_04255 [Balneolales bacterium]
MIKITFIILLFFAPFCISAQDFEPIISNELKFEDLFPGTDFSVRYTDAGAAKFIISNEPYSEAELAFQLPDMLQNSDHSMPITFSDTDAAYSITDNTDEAVLFNPNSVLTTSLNSEGKLYIWLGGTISPSANQAASFYSNDIMLNVTYTGN